MGDGTARRLLDPRSADLGFANRFTNTVLDLPGDRAVRTAGRCGGISAVVLDHRTADVPVPRWDARLFAPAHVPPDGHLLADAVLTRQLDSFATPSAVRFLTWSALPDADLGPVTGVRRRTRHELDRAVAMLDAGRPVVLGLVTARSPVRAGDNHQVVAYGHLRRHGRTVLLLADSNSPGREVELDETPQGWQASNGARWRGFFVHRWAPHPPPRVPTPSRHTSRRVDGPVGLLHVTSGRALRAATTRSGRAGHDVPDAAVLDDRATDGDRWQVDTAPGDGPVRVRHAATGRVLVAGTGGRVRLHADAPATWRLEVDGGGPWREGDRVRLVDDGSGRALGATLPRRLVPVPARHPGRLAPRLVDARTADAWWTVADRA